MKKSILITGKNSYIGTSFYNWIIRNNENYNIGIIDMKTDLWKLIDFSKYDTVFHVAGIAHKKETKKNAELYFKINRDLAIETARKAKNEGVKQFIFLSSMSVYGINCGIIGRNTPLNPKTNYGKSKLQAEQEIKNISNASFNVAIVRAPMIYGKGCKGNYDKLSKVVVKFPLFPDIGNERSMLYIDNLSEFIRLLIDECCSGLFHPQNLEYVNTSNMVKLIAKAHGKNIRMTKVFNPMIELLRINIIKKLFGSLTYERELSVHNKKYCVCDFETSIAQTEGAFNL